MIELSYDEYNDLMMILGAAGGMFQHLAKDASTPGIFKELMNDYAARAEELSENISVQVKKQAVKTVK